jgi:hypothetical protein
MADETKENLEEFLKRALGGVVEYARKMKTPTGQVHEEKYKFAPQTVKTPNYASDMAAAFGPSEAQAAPVEASPAPQAAGTQELTRSAQQPKQQPNQQPEPTKDDFSELLGALVQNMLSGEEQSTPSQVEPPADLFAQNPQLAGLLENSRRTNVPFLPTPEDQGLTRVMKAIAHGFGSTEQSRQAYQQSVEQNFALNLHMNQLKEQQKNVKTEMQFREMEALRHQQETQQKQRALQSLLLLTAVPGALQTQQGEMVGRVAGGMAGVGNVFPAKQDPFKAADADRMNQLIKSGKSPFDAAQIVRKEKATVESAGREPPSWNQAHQEEDATLKNLKPGMMEVPISKRRFAFEHYLTVVRPEAERKNLDVDYMDNVVQEAYSTKFLDFFTKLAESEKPEDIALLKKLGGK